MLDGEWHVEHMMLRATGGSDALANVVAVLRGAQLAKVRQDGD